MTQFFAAFEDLFKSIYELFASIIGTFVNAIQVVISTILNFFSGIINLFTDVFKGVVDVVGGVGSFVISKFFIRIQPGNMLYQSSLPANRDRQHCGPRRSGRRICHLHSPAARQACHTCKENQLRLKLGTLWRRLDVVNRFTNDWKGPQRYGKGLRGCNEKQ